MKLNKIFGHVGKGSDIWSHENGDMKKINYLVTLVKDEIFGDMKKIKYLVILAKDEIFGHIGKE